ncbi:hypothetical protein P9A16_03830 [Shinella sp. 838]|uniref:hypothetical protein n=1 Tax=Shinella sp. 838 TaxID=3038164 RepID=UPI00241531A3|nr:hypothetical protein [Shinella sp. 838]MDG4670237.1 hypothetical protein [Shinella sp. 838]
MLKSALDVKTVLDVELEQNSGLNSEAEKKLLELAGVGPTDVSAARKLRDRYREARTIAHPKAILRPSQNDHNHPLDRVNKAAKELLSALEALEEAHPHANAALWLNELWASPLFRPCFELPDTIDTKEMLSMTETRDDARYGARVLLHRLMTSAEAGKIQKNNRSREVPAKIIECAFDFYVRAAKRKPAKSAAGPFVEFAREFYFSVTGERDGPDIGKAAERIVKKRHSTVEYYWPNDNAND